ncbi:MAG: SRPBCC family protein [Byssovorax sp.]
MIHKTEFVYVTYISTTPEKVWSALQDAEMTKLFWGRARNVSDWQVGSTWTHGSYDDPAVIDVTGTIVESDPPKRLVVTWQSAKAPAGEPASRVTYLIESVFGAVRLTVTHDELVPDSPMAQGVSSGWPAILSSLKTLLETGAPMPMTTRRWGAPPA